jgi:anthranilate/para-aminobenzoate synthase component II
VSAGSLRGVVAVVDNYDSFTYNLVQYLGELGAATAVSRRWPRWSRPRW